MKQPRSIEANLISLGFALGAVLLVLVLSLFGIERALGSKLERLGASSMPAQQAITGQRHAFSRLFERQVQVLSARKEQELAALKDRSGIEKELATSAAALAQLLPGIVPQADAARDARGLKDGTREVLETDAALFKSVESRLATEARFDARTASLKTTLEKQIQEARAVAGSAHLEYVLELRRVADGAPPDKVVRGDARAQQEAAEQVVTAVLQLGQLTGKVALATHEDELNSIVANELAQNLSRARSFLRVLLATLKSDDGTFARAQKIQDEFENLANQITSATDAQSLVSLRRQTLREAVHAAELRARVLSGVKTLSEKLAHQEAVVARETLDATRSAKRALWLARAFALLGLIAAAVVALHGSRRLKESVQGLRAQNQKLENLSQELKVMNEGLEDLVAQRSAALVERERSMRQVLDAMAEGLISVDLSGKLVGESSQAAQAWFGIAPPGANAADYLFEGDETARQAFLAGFDQVVDDLLPFEVSVDCMPQRFQRGGRIFSVTYRQVIEDGRFQRVLLVVNDISDHVAAEARERDAREQHQLLAHLLKDREGFQVFVRDAERLILELRSDPERPVALRALHTLKGNAGVQGMESVASRCHAIETTLAEETRSISAEEAKSLADVWHARLGRIEEILTADAALSLDEAELAELAQGLRQRRDYAQLLDLVESWKWIKTSLLLQRLASQAHRVADKVGKTVEVRVEHNNLRVMPGALEDFWSSLIHVVRNAVDHGIEPAEDRQALGKPAQGAVVLCTSKLPDGGFSFELTDDGRGIDLERLRALAAQRGVTAKTQAELIDFMFCDGVTTKDQVSDLSGRGVGLSSVAAACRAAGGKLDVETVSGKGTCFRFFFPGQAVQVRQTHGSGAFKSLRPRPTRPPARRAQTA